MFLSFFGFVKKHKYKDQTEPNESLNHTKAQVESRGLLGVATARGIVQCLPYFTTRAYHIVAKVEGENVEERERNCEHTEEDVAHCQIADEDVSRCQHVLRRLF